MQVLINKYTIKVNLYFKFVKLFKKINEYVKALINIIYNI